MAKEEPKPSAIIATASSMTVVPHAYHYNLPRHHKNDDDDDGVPESVRFAELKARELYELAMSIQLSSQLFQQDEEMMEVAATEDEDDNMAVLEDDDDEDDDVLPTRNNNTTTPSPPTTLLTVSKQCARLHAQLSSLEQLKYSGLTQTQLVEMVLHLLNLVMCSIDPYTKQLYYDTVGYFVPVTTTEEPSSSSLQQEPEPLKEYLARPFALPSPTREVLLLIIVNILSKNGPLLSVSNAAIYQNKQTEDRMRFILHWKACLRLLLRTAPYLDEHQHGNTSSTTVSSSDAQYRQSTIIKRTSQLIRHARHFFDQSNNDKTARQVWEMVQTDCLFHSHTHACYRGTILLYLFQPTRCSSDYYLQVLPVWLECWTNIDRCPEFDFLWMALFCRARKNIAAEEEYDWKPIRQRLLTHAQYWLQLPIGGAAMDKSFPRAANPRSRSCPSRLKVFVGTNSSYEEGIDFVAKMVKLLVTGLGSGPTMVVAEQDDANTNASNMTTTTTMVPGISEGTQDVLRFLSFVTPYLNPSNIGSWTFTLGAFVHYFAYEMCCRVGATAGLDIIKTTHPDLAKEYEKVQPGASGSELPAHEFVALMDALLPICQQAIYSKNAHVGRAGEAAMLYLVQMDPVRAAPAFIDFAVRALDTTAINMSHQAPAALSVLTGLVQPSLRSDFTVLLSRLPEILRLSLAGIDSNDQHKSIRTLILYRSILSWMPVGGSPETWNVLDRDIGGDSRADGTRKVGNDLFDAIARRRETPEYVSAIDRLPSSSLLKQGVLPESYKELDMQRLVLEEASSALSDWSLEFLERVFGLLRASGEREKNGKASTGVASRHSSADVHQARNFSRVLTECLVQLFASMDDEVHKSAVRTVVRFIEEETLSFAAKDAAIICQAAAAARRVDDCVYSPGLDALVGTLTDNLTRHSTKTLVYRVRCLAGAVKTAGPCLMKHRQVIASTITFALASEDRHLLKTGCKLLRHTLATLSETYPISTAYRPRVYRGSCDGSVILGRSAQLHGDEVEWYVPDAACVEFFAELISSNVVNRLDELCRSHEDSDRCKMLSMLDVNELRRFLRVVRYSIRGGAGLLLDREVEGTNADDVVPYERASLRLLGLASETSKSTLLGIRGRLCSFLVVLSSVISSDTLYPDEVKELAVDDPYRKSLPLISSDPKIPKESCDIALLLLTRRGAAFRSQEARTIWRAQKELATDFTLCAEVDRMTKIFQMGNVFANNLSLAYKDGEDSGKTLPRRLLVTRVQLFHNSLQRNASFQVPRRLRRYEKERNWSRAVLFTTCTSLSEMMKSREEMLKCHENRPLDAYEGVVDGLFALCCHSNTHVRASAISVIDYAMTRFGWIVAPRVPRMLDGLALLDKECHGKFGVPSCAKLVDYQNQQGKRKRLSEAIKGVCSILSLTRSVRQMLCSWKLRLRFVQTLCGTDYLISLLPTEELQKTVHYLQAVFSPFRSSIYVLPRTVAMDKEDHRKCVTFVLGMLSEKNSENEPNESEEPESEGGKVHWKKLLFAAWFLLHFVDEDDIKDESPVSATIWSTCFLLLENNMGQPLQRVALGLLGKLLSVADSRCSMFLLKQKLLEDSFCRTVGRALVYDHKEDTSVGGGHASQWSTGVENIIRDAARHLAPKSLFPFQRTGQSLGSFKVPHSELVDTILLKLGDEAAAIDLSKRLLAFAKELGSAAPSEDQRNQQIAAAEIFAGVCSSCIRSAQSWNIMWTSMLLPHLEDVMGKIPFSLCGAYFDALRYSLQYGSPDAFLDITTWLVNKVQSTLWQPSSSSVEETLKENGSQSHASGAEGFTTQSKWLYLFSALIIEMDEIKTGNSDTHLSWYEVALAPKSTSSTRTGASNQVQKAAWKIVTNNLLPRLMDALGHPFDSCRDHIARCLFRICYSHRKMARVSASRAPSRESSEIIEIADDIDASDPGLRIINKLSSLRTEDSWSFIDRCNALNTARRFISYCVHLGEAKFEYSEYVIPLLSLVFEALNTVSDEDVSDSTPKDQDENAACRALESEVVKAYRFMISEISITAVISYGQGADISRVLDAISAAGMHSKWQVRHGSANFLRCFQGAHKFLFEPEHAHATIHIVTSFLADEQREVSAAGMAALTGILSAALPKDVALMVKKYVALAAHSKMKKLKKSTATTTVSETSNDKERDRACNQQVAVFFLCATVMAHPYDTPAYVPEALEAISKHSFERSAPLGVRDTVKKCCAEYKRTHMSDNWELHRSMFTPEQLEAFEDVTSTPHYYA